MAWGCCRGPEGENCHEAGWDVEQGVTSAQRSQRHAKYELRHFLIVGFRPTETLLLLISLSLYLPQWYRRVAAN
jgi:hypothetical protein